MEIMEAILLVTEVVQAEDAGAWRGTAAVYIQNILGLEVTLPGLPDGLDLRSEQEGTIREES